MLKLLQSHLDAMMDVSWRFWLQILIHTLDDWYDNFMDKHHKHIYTYSFHAKPSAPYLQLWSSWMQYMMSAGMLHYTNLWTNVELTSPHDVDLSLDSFQLQHICNVGNMADNTWQIYFCNCLTYVKFKR